MSPHLLGPDDAAAWIARRLDATWAKRVCQELTGSDQNVLVCGLRPGVTSGAGVQHVGLEAWSEWRIAWRHVNLSGLDGAELEFREISVNRSRSTEPLRLIADGLEAGLHVVDRLGGPRAGVDVERARGIGRRIRAAGGVLAPSTLKALCGLDDADVDVMVSALSWLRDHPELGEWTTRQLPVPGMDTKWLGRHGSLLGDLAERDVSAETRPRLSVVHLTYVDPTYLASGGRRHDAWTTGDHHELAYRPRVVVVVENRDCRLWFPDFPGTIVVEGGGKAAASSLGSIAWLSGADRLVYWGDIDADGYAILDAFRAEMERRGVRVESMLMDAAAFERYKGLGVGRDVNGEELKPSAVHLHHLTEAENAGYQMVATLGDAGVRRIEQERIPDDDVVVTLAGMVGGGSGPHMVFD